MLRQEEFWKFLSLQKIVAIRKGNIPVSEGSETLGGRMIKAIPEGVRTSEGFVATSEGIKSIKFVVTAGEKIIKEYLRKNLPYLGPKLASENNKNELSTDLERYLRLKIESEQKKPTEKEFFNVFMEGLLSEPPLAPFRCYSNSWRKNERHLGINEEVKEATGYEYDTKTK